MKFKFTLIVVALFFLNCQSDKKPQLSYKYITSESSTLSCETVDMKLFEEARLSFENDIIQHYTPGQETPSRAYSQFMRAVVRNNVKFNEVASEHSRNIYEVLRADKDLWLENDNTINLNYNHPIFECIGKKITDNDMRRTYNALLSTNSMSMRMIGNELQRKSYVMNKDKYAAVFSALITYYDNFHNLDFSDKTVGSEATKEKSVANNKKQTRDDHAGHSH